jgi:peptidoglycan/xylan/chitin deacetylase (PgdA/CDA1 family)
VEQEQRDFIGYGRNVPKVEWPNDARIAVNVVINYEVGAELNPLDGDSERETAGEFYPLPPDERSLGNESVYEYGSRAGVWRILRLLEEYEVNGTIFACGRAMERNPQAARSFTELGHDIVGHGYRWEQHWGMDPGFERDQIRRTVKAVQETSGYLMKGWFCRYLRSFDTRRILLDEGFLFDSTDFSDDLPFFVPVDGKPLLIVPYTLDNNDVRFVRGTFLTAEQFFEYLRDSFDMLYKEGATNPRMMSIGLHDRIIGRPGPAKGLEMFLDYARRFPDAWFARRTDLAEWWIQKYSPEGA